MKLFPRKPNVVVDVQPVFQGEKLYGIEIFYSKENPRLIVDGNERYLYRLYKAYSELSKQMKEKTVTIDQFCQLQIYDKTRL